MRSKVSAEFFVGEKFYRAYGMAGDREGNSVCIEDTELEEIVENHECVYIEYSDKTASLYDLADQKLAEIYLEGK